MSDEIESKPQTAREELRAATLGAPCVVESRIVEWNGHKYELRRPSIKQQQFIDKISRAKDGKQDSVKALCFGLVECVFVPGTDEKVFEATDVENMKSRGMKDFVGHFMRELGEMSEEVDPEEIEKNSESGTTA